MDNSPSFAELQAEIARLRAREQQLTHLLSSARDAILGIDAQGMVIEWNQGAQHLLGWTAAQTLGQPLVELIIPHEFRAAHSHGLSRYLATRQTTMLNRMIEVEALRKDGSRIPVELSVWPIVTGECVQFGAILRDMSERKQAQRQLEMASERYRAVVEHLGEGMVVVNRDRVVFANRQASNIVEMPVGDMLTHGYLHRVHPDDRTMVDERRLRRLRGEPVPDRYEVRLLLPDERVKWIDIGVTIVPWDGEAATLTFFSDVTARKQLQQQLAATLQERETILNSSVVGIVFLTANGRFRWANPAMRALFKGDTVTPLLSMEQVYTSREQYLRVGGEVAAAIARGEVYQAELPMRRLDGQPLWVALSGQAVSPRDLGEGTVWTVLDITGRKQAEEDTRHALAQQRELNDMRARFVAVTSHEFRTPLATIFSSAELLDDYGCDFPEDERHEVLGLIKGAVARMNGMVEQVLLTSQLESGGFGYGPAPQMLPLLLTQLVDEMQRSDAHRHLMHCECTGLTQPRQADARLLRHIVTNLLGNALKYSATGRQVWLRAHAEGEHVRLEVQDQGIGIPQTDLPRLFERFHRGTNVGNIQGTGMGLHIVQECVALHAGRLEVSSEEGGGTTFKLWLHAPEVAASPPLLHQHTPGPL